MGEAHGETRGTVVVVSAAAVRSAAGFRSLGAGATGPAGSSAAAAGPGRAQNPRKRRRGSDSQQQPPKPVFRTGADLVRVDVAVLDKKGVPGSVA